MACPSRAFCLEAYRNGCGYLSSSTRQRAGRRTDALIISATIGKFKRIRLA
jgi:hypothetical protein